MSITIEAGDFPISELTHILNEGVKAKGPLWRKVMDQTGYKDMHFVSDLNTMRITMVCTGETK